MAVLLKEDQLNYWFRSALYQRYWDLRHKAEQTEDEKEKKKIQEKARIFHRIADKAEAARSNITNAWERALAYEGLLKYMDFIHTEPYLIDSRGNTLEAELAMDQLMPEYYDYYNAIKLFREAAFDISTQDMVQGKKRVLNDLKWCEECLNIPDTKMSDRRSDIVASVANYPQGSEGWEYAESIGMSKEEWERCCDILVEIEEEFFV